MLAGYRTLIFNAVMGLVFVVRALVPDAELPSEAELNSILDQLIANLDYIITVVGNVILRFKTKTAVFSKGPA